MRYACIASVILLLQVFPAFAQTDDPRGIKVLYREARSALVIGNGAYTSSPLANPVNDAEAMASLLEKRNFKVTLLKNADLQRMEAAVEIFGQSLGAGGVGLFFYAGHGMQIEGRNYLIPVGAQIENERDVKYNALDVGKVLGKMEDAGNRLNVVFLDACRDNPFARSFRTQATGLAQLDAPSGTLIAYATAPGKLAADGVDSNNSIYTRYLIEQLGVPGEEIGTALRAVRTKVRATTGNRQTPWESTSLEGAFYLTPIDMLDENLALSRAQLESLKKLQSEQAQAAANLKKLETEKNAEMAKLDAEIAALRKQANEPGQSGSSLDQLIELGERRAAVAAELAATQQRAEAERQKREAEIATIRAAELAKRKKAFEDAYAKYQRICTFVQAGHLGAAEQLAAWQTLCADFDVKNPGDKPTALAWDEVKGVVQLASLVLIPSGSGGKAAPYGSAFYAAPGANQTVFLDSGVSIDLVPVKAGSFQMGSNDGSSDEKPVRTVRITRDFWMGKTEVTQKQYQQIMGSNPSKFTGDDLPVEQVSWEDAVKFCDALTKRERTVNCLPQGYVYRLPTEAEWEYAARGGAQGRNTQYAGSDNPDLVAWHGGNSGDKTQRVGTKAANELGLHDMSGNVYEWSQDWYQDSYSGLATTNPTGAATGSNRVGRGGGWYYTASRCRVAFRLWPRPSSAFFDLGFRVVLAPDLVRKESPSGLLDQNERLGNQEPEPNRVIVVPAPSNLGSLIPRN